MARPAISQIVLSDTLILSECHPTSEHRGAYWLYDKTREMNLVMGANTQQDAFVQALTYYQNRLIEVERAYKSLGDTVNQFVNTVRDDDDDDD